MARHIPDASLRKARSLSPTALDVMPALTGIRFPLALWVVAHHLTGPGRMFDPLISAVPLLQALVDAAWVALSVFFAISGFVLTRRYRADTWSWDALCRYAVARVGRIYPVYLLSLCILVPIMIEGRDTLGTPLERVGLILNHLLLLQGWHRPAVNWNTPAWSLSAEVFFYACLPLILILLGRASLVRWCILAAVAFILPITLRLWLDPPIAKPLLYFGDFLIGIVAAGVYDHLRQHGVPLRRLGPWVYTPAMVGGCLLLVYRDALGSFLVFDSGVRLVSGLLVLGLACGGGVVWRGLSSPLLLIGGRASYAIYILHVPVLWWFQRSAIHAALPPVAAGAIFVAWVIVLSVVVSRGYEEPANTIVRRWFEDRQIRRRLVRRTTPAVFRRSVKLRDP